MPVAKRKAAKKHPHKKTAMCSLRVESHLKEKLRVAAKQRALSLSSFIEQVLRDFLESQDSAVALEETQRDRRQYPRKEVVLPARWRLRRGKEEAEHDVLLKNISAGGAYTEYMNGQIYRLFDNNQVSSLRLAVRLPGLQEAVSLECEAVRFHITRDCLGVGLRYTKMTDQKIVAALDDFLA